MKNVLTWIKSNPFITICGAIALFGLVGMGYLRFVEADKFTQTRSEELEQINKRQKALMRVSVPLPDPDPNAPPITETVVVNQKVINGVNQIYSTLKKQYDQIAADASAMNAKPHLPYVLGGSSIWPDSGEFADYVRATADYKDHFKALFDYGNTNTWGMPVMRASKPPTRREVDQILANTAFNFINSIGVTSASSLTKEQAEQLFSEQRVALMSMLTGRAGSINLYASLPLQEDDFHFAEEGDDTPTGSAFGGGGDDSGKVVTGLPSDYPFTIADWAFAETPPSPDQLWEGQVQLWIMRDIMHAVYKLNRIDSGVEVTKPDGSKELEPATVINSPIKRLLLLDTLPGYVGLHSIGGLFADSSNTASSFDDGGFEGGAGGFSASGSGSAAAGNVYKTPPIQLKPKEASVLASDHFGLSPTGHTSNGVYDVRHTRLVIDIEWKDLPAFMEKLREQNFLTVVKTNVQNLDEYELLTEGYVYGSNDVVRADLLIESLWYRNWTSKLMPKKVREALLIEIPAGLNSTGLGFE